MAIHLHSKLGELAIRLATRVNTFETPAASGVRQAFDSRSSGIMLKGRLDHAYDEGVFQHFLLIEFKRSERSKRPFLLLLLDLKEEPPATNRNVAPEVATKLFSSLARCLRETDFVGWYREGRVVGAVLTQFQEAPGPEISEVVGQRVREALRGSIPSSALDRLKICAYQRPPSLKVRD
jgi:hypothetical protein